MGSEPGDNAEDGGFELTKSVSQGLSAAECADRLEQLFANISQELPALDTNQLPTLTQLFLKGNKPLFANQTLDSRAWNALYFKTNSGKENLLGKKKAKKSGVPGDFPTKMAKKKFRP